MPNRLQCLDVPIVSDEDCEKAYPGMITRRMTCAGYMDGGRDACNVRTMANERTNQYAPAYTDSICLTGRLRQPPGMFWRSPWTGVMGSGMCPSRLSRSLRQSLWIPLLDWRSPTNLLLKITQSSHSSVLSPCFWFSPGTFSSYHFIKTQHVFQNAGKSNKAIWYIFIFLCPLSLSFILLTGINRCW